jgi:hypothetical protein
LEENSASLVKNLMGNSTMHSCQAQNEVHSDAPTDRSPLCARGTKQRLNERAQSPSAGKHRRCVLQRKDQFFCPSAHYRFDSEDFFVFSLLRRDVCACVHFIHTRTQDARVSIFLRIERGRPAQSGAARTLSQREAAELSAKF